MFTAKKRLTTGYWEEGVGGGHVNGMYYVGSHADHTAAIIATT